MVINYNITVIDYINGEIDYTSSVLKKFNTASLAFSSCNRLQDFTDLFLHSNNWLHIRCNRLPCFGKLFLTLHNRLPCVVIDYHCHWTVYINLKCDFRIKKFFCHFWKMKCVICEHFNKWFESLNTTTKSVFHVVVCIAS